MKKIAGSRRYSPEERKRALVRSDEIGPTAAGKELGIPEGTICNWRYLEKKQKALDAAQVAEATTAKSEAKPESRTTTPVKKQVARRYTPSLRAKVIEYVAEHGVSAAAKEFDITRFAIYDWLRKNGVYSQGKMAENFPGLYPHFEDDVREVPDTFQKAYVLAMCAYYRGHAQQTARNLILEVYSLQRRLQRLEEGLNRMAYTTPLHRGDPNGIYCPF